MKIDCPAEGREAQLQALWKEAFGDEDAVIDSFFSTAYASDRCRCITEGDEILAALHILDCKCDDRPVAYLYAVATAKKHRRKGLCRRLMEDTRRVLGELGYHGILLMPENEALRRFYGSMGYETCTAVTEFSCRAGDTPATLQPLTAQEYAARRRAFLPAGGVLQEGVTLDYLVANCRLFAGEGFLYAENAELLGDASAAPGILKALEKPQGLFRTPGAEKPFAMYLPLQPGRPPKYFGLALD